MLVSTAPAQVRVLGDRALHKVRAQAATFEIGGRVAGQLSQGVNVVRVRESKAAPVGVVLKVLRILEVLRDAPYGLQLKDVAKLTAINKSTAYRFLAHLESAGYLFRGDTGVYTIGPNFARLSTATNFRETLRQMCRPVLQKLWEATGETVNLGVLDGHEVLYVDVIESPHYFRLASHVGFRRPLYCTSLGKALTAHLPTDKIEELLASIRFERSTPRTIVQAAKFRRELADVRRKGYAVDDQEAVLGARCVAAPIFDAGNRVIAAISVSGPITRIAGPRMSQFASLVKESSQSISARLPGVGDGSRSRTSSSRAMSPATSKRARIGPKG